MKNLIYLSVMLLCSGIMAQERPKEIKQETVVKTVKVNDGETISEKKFKVVTREEADVELDENDAEKVNQNRVMSNVKVKKTVSIDNDTDDDYETQSSVMYYKLGEDNYKFEPNKNCFEIVYSNNTSDNERMGSAWNSNSKGHYIINGKSGNGIGYFDNDGNLVVEYYDKTTNKVETKTYTIKK